MIVTLNISVNSVSRLLHLSTYVHDIPGIHPLIQYLCSALDYFVCAASHHHHYHASSLVPELMRSRGIENKTVFLTFDFFNPISCTM